MPAIPEVSIFFFVNQPVNQWTLADGADKNDVFSEFVFRAGKRRQKTCDALHIGLQIAGRAHHARVIAGIHKNCRRSFFLDDGKTAQARNVFDVSLLADGEAATRHQQPGND